MKEIRNNMREFSYHKKIVNGKVVQLAIYEKTPEQFNFVSGFSSVSEMYELGNMEEIQIEEYKELINVLNIGHRYESPIPVER